jgi:NADH-quinone oxidoreductase subunit N
VPFHFWAPDTYQGAPVPVAAFLSVASKAAGFTGLLAICFLGLRPYADVWGPLLAVLAVITMTMGNLVAMQQKHMVRLLAYSSIAQSGYFLLGVVAVERGDLALPALVVFAAAYAAMNLGAFAVVALAGRELRDFAGLGRSRPMVRAAMVVFLISLVGVPPLAGFVGKLLLFGAAIETGFTWLAVVAILNSVLSLAVYLRIVVPMYQMPKGVPVSRRSVAAVWGVALVATVGVGLAAQALLAGVS